MKKFFKVIALVAVFILSSFGMSEASSYNFVSMSNLTPQEFIQQMEELSQQEKHGPLTFSDLNYGGPDADDAYTIYVAHMGKYTTVKFRCDNRGMVSSVMLKHSRAYSASDEEFDAQTYEQVDAEHCIMKIIGLNDEEIQEFYNASDGHSNVTEKMYPRISKRVIECSSMDVDRSNSSDPIYTSSYAFFVSIE